jgi:tetraacyldisaccharide 4'-kinase
VHDNALISGDEPLQFKRKFNNIVVAVSESRTLAIPLIVKNVPDIQLILLDDAFQHRAIIPGLNILLTTYDQPFTRDILLPAGRLREFPESYHRADVIIVSKCPESLDEEERNLLAEELGLKNYQHLFFSKYHYHSPYSLLHPTRKISLTKDLDVILVSAIANTAYLRSYLEGVVDTIHELEYEDHHIFSERDIEYLTQVFENRDTPNKIILTTEKDAMRLDLHRQLLINKTLPIYVLPVEVRILFDQEEEFNSLIKSFLLNFKV